MVRSSGEDGASGKGLGGTPTGRNTPVEQGRCDGTDAPR